MIVEDDPRMARALEDRLDAFGGFECVAVCDRVSQAVRAAKHHQPDVILFDLVLHREEVPEAIARLREVAPRATVLVVTAYEDTDLIVRSLMAGAHGYLLKSDGLHDLPKRLLSALHEGVPISPRVIRRVRSIFHEIGASHRAGGLESLDPIEWRILDALASGKTNREIADDLAMGYEGVKSRVEVILEKLQVRNRAQAAATFGKGSWMTRWTHLGSPRMGSRG